MRKPCIWCHGREGSVETLEVQALGVLPWRPRALEVHVHTEHRSAAIDYFRRSTADGPHVVTALIGLSLLPIPVVLAAEAGWLPEWTIAASLGLSFALIAAAIWRWPFATTDTIRMFGIQRSIRLARGAGVAMGVLAIALPLLITLAD